MGALWNQEQAGCAIKSEFWKTHCWPTVGQVLNTEVKHKARRVVKLRPRRRNVDGAPAVQRATTVASVHALSWGADSSKERRLIGT